MVMHGPCYLLFFFQKKKKQIYYSGGEAKNSSYHIIHRRSIWFHIYGPSFHNTVVSHTDAKCGDAIGNRMVML